MTTLILCLFIASLLPVLTKAPLAFAMHNNGGYNNSTPRRQQQALTGFGERALAQHQNSFEALIVYAPAIVLAIALQQTSELIQTLAILHLLCRIGYSLLYLLNWHYLRSIVWAIGYACPLIIIWQCLQVV